MKWVCLFSGWWASFLIVWELFGLLRLIIHIINKISRIPFPKFFGCFELSLSETLGRKWKKICLTFWDSTDSTDSTFRVQTEVAAALGKKTSPCAQHNIAHQKSGTWSSKDPNHFYPFSILSPFHSFDTPLKLTGKHFRTSKYIDLLPQKGPTHLPNHLFVRCENVRFLEFSKPSRVVQSCLFQPPGPTDRPTSQTWGPDHLLWDIGNHLNDIYNIMVYL